jgi:hypothetical protein
MDPMLEFPLGVPNHAGQPNDPDDIFFGDTQEIGKIASAQTNLNRTRGFRRWTGARIGWTVLGVFLGGLVGVFGSVLLEGLDRALGREYFWVPMAAGVFLGALLFAWLGRPWQLCTFVGQGGFMRVKRRADRLKLERMRFQDAAELRLKQTRNYYNGIYTGTSFDYRWRDATGRALFVIAGVFRENAKKPPRPDHPIHFAQAAERAWLDHRLPAVLERVKSGQEVRFPVGKGKYLAVGRGYLELGLKGEARRLEPADIESLKLDQGWLTVKPRGAGWFGSAKVMFADIGDGKILLALVEKHLGIPVG